jgi:hypothetical protein
MGVISNAMAAQTLHKCRHVKPPADNPEDVLPRGLLAEQILQKWMVLMPLAVGHYLH